MNEERSVADAGAGERQGSLAGWGRPRERTIQWHSLELGAEPAQAMSGLEFLQAVIERRLPPPPIAAVTAMELVAAEPGAVELRCVPDESWLNPNGHVHGGLLCSLMDSSMGLAVLSTRGSLLEPYTSIELKVSFIKPLPWDGQAVTVRGRTLRVGRKVAFAEAHAHTADGALVGHATSSLAAVGANS